MLLVGGYVTLLSSNRARKLVGDSAERLPGGRYKVLEIDYLRQLVLVCDTDGYTWQCPVRLSTLYAVGDRVYILPGIEEHFGGGNDPGYNEDMVSMQGEVFPITRTDYISDYVDINGWSFIGNWILPVAVDTYNI